MDPAGVDALREAVRRMHRCEAKFAGWEQARDEFGGEVAFDRPVAVFDLVGCDLAARAFAWSEPGSAEGRRRFFAVLAAPPIATARDAVRASIVADARR